MDDYLHYIISDKSLLGYVLSAATQRGLCALFMGDSPRELVSDLQLEFPGYLLMYSHRGLGDVAARIFNFAGGPPADIGLTLDAGGTRLERRVWDVLRAIPIGETTTYSEIARKIGVPSESHAVAQACMRNRIALAIPCHRAVGSAGDIGDYRWGLARKRALLKIEAHILHTRPGNAPSRAPERCVQKAGDQGNERIRKQDSEFARTRSQIVTSHDH